MMFAEYSKFFDFINTHMGLSLAAFCLFCYSAVTENNEKKAKQFILMLRKWYSIQQTLVVGTPISSNKKYFKSKGVQASVHLIPNISQVFAAEINTHLITFLGLY